MTLRLLGLVTNLLQLRHQMRVAVRQRAHQKRRKTAKRKKKKRKMKMKMRGEIKDKQMLSTKQQTWMRMQRGPLRQWSSQLYMLLSQVLAPWPTLRLLLHKQGAVWPPWELWQVEPILEVFESQTNGKITDH